MDHTGDREMGVGRRWTVGVEGRRERACATKCSSTDSSSTTFYLFLKLSYVKEFKIPTCVKDTWVKDAWQTKYTIDTV